MGETQPFQPLTREDRITVVLYRTGIVLSALVVCFSAFIAYRGVATGALMITLLLLLYCSIGLSVYFIHLYVGKFHRMLKKIYALAVICLAVLFFTGNGNPVMPLLRVPPYGALLLIPLSLCLGFVTAKEAFCFRLFEGYFLAMIMPACIFFYGLGILSGGSVVGGLVLIALLLAFFTLRKALQPIHYDIGDKSAYQP